MDTKIDISGMIQETREGLVLCGQNARIGGVAVVVVVVVVVVADLYVSLSISVVVWRVFGGC